MTVRRVPMLLPVLVGKNPNLPKLQLTFSTSLEIASTFGTRGTAFLAVVPSSGLARFGSTVNRVFVLAILVSRRGPSIALVFITVLGILPVTVWTVLIVYLACRAILRMCILLVINVPVTGIVRLSPPIMTIGIIGLAARTDLVSAP